MTIKGQYPANIFSLPNIHAICLGANKNLTGFLPEFKQGSPLRILMLVDTSFSGEIPTSIGNLRSLQTLSIARCAFMGTIPGSMSNLTQLTTLWMGNNNFRQGRFPPCIGKLPQLDFLDLISTNLKGEIPPTLENLTCLLD